MKTIKIKNKSLLLDDSDYEIYKDVPMKLIKGRSTSYVMINKDKLYLHRVLMNAPKGMEVDHIDSNGLNNQRSNLRISTITDNRRNRSKCKTRKTSSKYIGVMFIKNRPNKPWKAYICNTFIGVYHTEKEAAKARDKEAQRLYGEYAKLNFE